MGKTILNTALATLSGKIDAWVYRRRAGRVMVAKKPDFTAVVPSARQLAFRERFLKAIEYGKAVNTDSVRREPYAKAAEGTLSRQPQKRQPQKGQVADCDINRLHVVSVDWGQPQKGQVADCDINRLHVVSVDWRWRRKSVRLRLNAAGVPSEKAWANCHD